MTLDTVSRVPHAYTVMNPSAVDWVEVTFNDTAPTPDTGTYPARPVICTRSSYPPETCCLATSRNAFGDCPARVSNTRFGPTDV